MPKPTNRPAAKKTTPVAAPAPETRTLKAHEIVLSSSVQNVVSVDAWSKFAGAVDLLALIAGLREQVKDVADGNMRPIEAMLYGQAMALQTIFTSLSKRAAANDGLKQFQVNLTLALKAQAQCRATLEALAEIKNPRPVSFVKQANITSGPQQVNNGMPDAHANQNAVQQNELLEHQHGNCLDTGAQSKAGGANSKLEAVEAGYRSAHA